MLRKQFDNRCRLITILLVLLLLISAFPMTCFAAEENTEKEDSAPPIPEEMLDNYPLRAIAYAGYDVERLTEEGNLYQPGYYGRDIPKEYNTKIFYSGKSFGVGTVKDDTTPTGLAPNIKTYEKYGMDCTAFASYYYFNYLRNVEGLDVDDLWTHCFKFGSHGGFNTNGSTARTVYNWHSGAEKAVETGRGYKVGDSAEDLCKAQAGDLIIFRYKTKENKRMHHVSIYIGEYNGKNYIAHVGNDRGPEIQTVQSFKSSEVFAIYHFYAAEKPSFTSFENIDLSQLTAQCLTGASIPDVTEQLPPLGEKDRIEEEQNFAQIQ